MWLISMMLLGQTALANDLSPVKQRAALEATVRIIDWSDHDGTIGAGAVVGFDEDYLYLLTAFHVVNPGKRLEVQWFAAAPSDGSAGRAVDKPIRTFLSAIDVVAVSRAADLALLRVRTDYRPEFVLRIRPLVNFPEKIATVMSIGCDLGSHPMLVTERVKGLTVLPRPQAHVSFWVTDAAPIKGRSGGPLVGPDGDLIGICRGYLAAKGTLPAEGLYSSLEEIHSLVATSGISTLIEKPWTAAVLPDQIQLSSSSE